MRLYGLWLGLIAGYGVTTLISGYAVCRSDWALIAKQAQERSEALPRAAPCHEAGADDTCGSGGGGSVQEGATDTSCGRQGGGMRAPLLAGAAADEIVPSPKPTGRAPPAPDTPVSEETASEWATAD